MGKDACAQLDLLCEETANNKLAGRAVAVVGDAQLSAAACRSAYLDDDATLIGVRLAGARLISQGSVLQALHLCSNALVMLHTTGMSSHQLAATGMLLLRFAIQFSDVLTMQVLQIDQVACKCRAGGGNFVQYLKALAARLLRVAQEIAV